MFIEDLDLFSVDLLMLNNYFCFFTPVDFQLNGDRTIDLVYLKGNVSIFENREYVYYQMWSLDASFFTSDSYFLYKYVQESFYFYWIVFFTICYWLFGSFLFFRFYFVKYYDIFIEYTKEIFFIPIILPWVHYFNKVKIIVHQASIRYRFIFIDFFLYSLRIAFYFIIGINYIWQNLGLVLVVRYIKHVFIQLIFFFYSNGSYLGIYKYLILKKKYIRRVYVSLLYNYSLSDGVVRGNLWDLSFRGRENLRKWSFFFF